MLLLYFIVPISPSRSLRFSLITSDLCSDFYFHQRHREESLSNFSIFEIIIHYFIMVQICLNTGIGIENRMHTTGTTFGAKS